MLHELDYDVLVIGTGAAGMTLALSLPDHLRIGLVSKGELGSGSTEWAQGGVAAVLETGDSVDNHIRDTETAGAGLCHPAAVRFTVEHSAEAIRWLVDLGVPFTEDAASALGYHLTREGGHSHRRIIHAADATGHAITATLNDRVRQAAHIEVLTWHTAVDLITTEKLGLQGPRERSRCLGAYLYNQQADHVVTCKARQVVLATGGASKVYLYTSNPDGSTGDGIAMAWRAGCRLANMEFNQFHPTCLYHPHAKSFLISEAVRGEGGRLLLPDGKPFMQHFDSRVELAPRDIVARAIDHEMKRLGADHLYLDISHRDADFIQSHFPTIRQRCLDYGIDITREPIPVVPAAHYTCGGVVTDLYGRTDIDNLYAIGECAHTGLHGANRLASNSLLECLVFGRAAAIDISRDDTEAAPLPIPAWDESRVTDSDEDVVIAHNWDEVRRFMWDYVGIVRTSKRLLRARHRVNLLQAEIHEFYSNYRISNDLLELRNLVAIAEAIIESAIQRQESRGLHFTLDYPERLDTARDTILPGKTRTKAESAPGRL
ncbi:L-aspartate oxidase [Natronospirillum operosum]|uniref:L-aspartate oxidase n=1 Tax=Natronospirillum operosum TaxID=2759953 RepID=A0A4Z0WC08_9GAMM|nr:L-aspartate oxidase [Natronospirillum operosum]TGG91110.1 L-aspartate oxidase [Natronospirillum operosum]